MQKILILFLTFLSLQTLGEVNIMAPLVLNSEAEWSDFKRRLSDLRTLGVKAISTDVWWGMVEKEQGVYDWSYYKRLARIISESGLNWVPIMSFHQCGGNVGDNCNVPIPEWAFESAKNKSVKSFFSESSYLVEDSESLKYLSELGNVNSEHPSVWSTPLMVDHYKNFFKDFTREFKNYSDIIDEVNISLGAAGELRYPSYNSHDQVGGDARALFPGRGIFQGMSDLAKFSFKDFQQARFGRVKFPMPSNVELSSALDRNDIQTEKMKTLFEWYHTSLLEHGKMVLKGIDEVKKETSFKNFALGAKVPGIHWNMGEDYGLGLGFKWGTRLSEVTAGLISPHDPLMFNEKEGAGYRNLLSTLKEIKEELTSPFILHFTCLEMNNNDNADMKANSMAKSLVHWFGNEAAKNSLVVKGENALEGLLYQKQSWININDAMDFAHYKGLTILRMGPLTDNPEVKEHIAHAARRSALSCFSMLGAF